jgi:c-di-GMP-binding flagellar brake protein YcgR
MNSDERRKFKRFDAYMNVKFKLPSNDSFRGVSLSKDLSREGIKMNSNQALSIGQTVNIEIDIPDDPKPVLTTGTVMWSRSAEGGKDGFDQGVRFAGMDPVDKFRVLDYAYNYWLENETSFSATETLDEEG